MILTPLPDWISPLLQGEFQVMKPVGCTVPDWKYKGERELWAVAPTANRQNTLPQIKFFIPLVRFKCTKNHRVVKYLHLIFASL